MQKYKMSNIDANYYPFNPLAQLLELLSSFTDSPDLKLLSSHIIIMKLIKIDYQDVIDQT